jgi:ABC-type amino acid transport substrate-binding protein
MLSRLIPFGFIVLFASGVEARDLQVALGAQDASQLDQRVEVNKAVVQPGSVSSFNEALAREICRRVGARCVITPMRFAEILPGVEAGQFEMGFGNFLRSPDREKRVAFSEAIWRSSSRLVAKPQVAEKLAQRIKQEVTLDSLREVRVACIEGSQQYVYLRRVAEEQALTLVPVKTMADLLVALRENKADFTLEPMLSAYVKIAKEAPGSYEFVGPPVADRGLGGTVHIAIPKQKEDVLLVVNQAITAMRADGTYQRIVRQFFPFSMD